MPRLAKLLLLLLVLLPSAAQARQLWGFRTFTRRDGLAHNVVRGVLEDSKGMLWFATMGGLTRYEPRGGDVEKVELGRVERQEVMALAEGRDGSLWAATQGGGVGRLSHGKWTWYTTHEGLPSDEITSLLVDHTGQVWATPTAGGLARFDGRRWRTYGVRDGLSSGEIGRCTELRSGALLCATYEVPVLQRFEHGRWSQMPVEVAGARPFYVHALLETRHGELWLASKGAGVLQGRRHGGTYRWTVHDSGSGLPANRAGHVIEAADGSIWVATTAGVARWDGHRWQILNRRDGLGSNQIFSITQSRDGALWFASLGGGASRYSPSRWEQIGEAEGLPSDNLTGGLLLESDGTLWAGTDEGLAVRRGKRWTVYRAGRQGLDHIHQIARARDGTLWVATRGGLRRLVGDQLEDAPGLEAAPVSRMAEDRSGRLWLATRNGVDVLDRRGARKHYGLEHGLPSLRVNDLVVDRRGRVWSATDNGVAHLEGERWVRALGSAAASRVSRINSLALDHAGDLWAAGLEGIRRLQGGEWQSIPAGPWLPLGLYSRFVMATSDGSLWFAVRGLGVRRLRGGIWTAFSSRDGLGADTVSDVKLADDGRLLFATLGGGISLHRPDRDPPVTHLGASADPEPSGAPSRVVQGETTVIHFGGVDALKDTETADLVYSWRLDEGPWSPFSPSTRAVLRGLKAGNHRFEVRAMDQDMNVDPTPAQHHFQVVRPWWAEPWLLLLLAFAVVLALIAAVRTVRAVARERAAVQQEQAALGQRREFVRLASHELRKPLARMAHRAEILAQPGALGAESKRAEYADAIAEDSRRLARLVETLLDQARVQQGLKLELRVGDLRELVAAVLREFEGEPHADALRPQPWSEPLSVEHDSFLLPLAVRNLVDNALKYAGGSGPIEVRSERDQRQRNVARLLVRDHGPGIPAEERARIFDPFFRGRSRAPGEVSGFGLGLSFARDIARAHGGELALEPSEAGATFCLTLPLRES